MCNSNTELPGTWEEADFTGGETDMAGIVAVGIAKDIVFGHAKQLSTSDRTKLLPDNPDPGGQPCMCRFVGDDLVQQCGKRTSLPAGTLDGAEKCPKCGQWSMTLDRYRLTCRREGTGKDHPPRCDCHGAKGAKEDKIQYRRGVRIVLGPHRKGQAGCIHHPDFGKTDQELYEEDLAAQDDGYRVGDDCPF